MNTRTLYAERALNEPTGNTIGNLGRGGGFAHGEAAIYLALVDEIFRHFRKPTLIIPFPLLPFPFGIGNFPSRFIVLAVGGRLVDSF